ncbi:LuxR C-terminal-related transcriptional regulator [Clostridium coskatii]|uniref:HTH-type transcriptional regulator MalT n=1 Tax=Clostridium coskatii TaxID=1705578 RepID=A0A166TR87_9CLOT|nr:LuxR C-terminal-related transcriptional regulator [Clostridium coskatii]OAA93990.1 HTH-type transcriptional regulator MalT [Clostridium coskatii]OBR90191.1 HTH-type transcriptional regulator MalT [Clostridium coskatii]
MLLNYKYNNTKFLIPKKKCKIIDREKVLSRLDEVLKTKLTIISAAAGSGKTTSVISWIYSRNLDHNTVWISLDERDNNVNVFWRSISTAIEKFKNNDINCKEEDLIQDQDISSESAVNMALASISSVNKDLILVIDDLHFVKNEDILVEIKHFIEGISDNIHIIITSRTKLSINISKLRLDGEVTEIGKEDLSFSLEETDEFIKTNIEITMPKESVQILNKYTEGWIAGIQMTVLSIKERKNVTEMNEKFIESNKYIQDYFCEEIFNRQSEEIKDFLLKTCILDELNIELCNAVSCMKNSQQILEKIYDKNLFINKLDYDGKLFKYDILFKKFLMSKANVINKEEMREASNKAAKWYENNGRINNAVNQYISIENYEQAIEVIEDKCIKETFINEYFYVENWLKNIPQDVIVKNARFCIIYMYTYIYDDINYKKYLEFAEKALKSCTDEDYKKECLGILYIIRGDKSYIELDYKKSISYYENALNYLGKDMFWHTIINLKSGIVYFYLQDFVLEEKFFHESIILSQSYKDNTLNLMTNRIIIFAKLLKGELNECENICNTCLNSTISNDLEKSSLMSIFYVALALVYYEKNYIIKAEEYVFKGLELVEEWDFYTAFIGYYVYSGVVLKNNKKNQKSELNKIYEKVQELSKKYKNNKLADKYYFYKLKDHFKVLEMERFIEYGRIKCVEKYIAKRDFKIAEELVVFSKILMCKGKNEDALMLLNKILASDKEKNSNSLIIRAYIFRSEILSQKDQYENATKDLRQALIIGYKSGFVRLFLIKQTKARKILIKTIKSMKFNKDYYEMGDYLNKILSLYSTKEDSQIISKREREVLMLIEKGAKNSEIAKRLFITESTAKSHILNIFSKLSVRNRIEAVAKAKEIGII